MTRTTKQVPAKVLNDAKRMVRHILAHHFGKAHFKMPPKIEHLSGGLTNFVFSVQHEAGDYIVRMSPQRDKLASFMKEQWAIAKAREVGVPAPEVLQVGNEAAKYPYMISRHSKGTAAALHPNRLGIVRQMGRYAALINKIPTKGFGATFEWSRNQLSHNATWAEFLTSELGLEDRLTTLGALGMMKPPQLKRLRAVLERAARKSREPALNHGDLRLKNVLVDDKGAISCILDWEHALSNLAPEWEWSIALHDLSIDEKQEFLDGYGLDLEKTAAITPVVKAINLVNYVPAMQLAAKSKNAAALQWYRLRISGALDLYSF